jgi:hypothetical protein
MSGMTTRSRLPSGGTGVDKRRRHLDAFGITDVILITVPQSYPPPI